NGAQPTTAAPSQNPVNSVNTPAYNWETYYEKQFGANSYADATLPFNPLNTRPKREGNNALYLTNPNLVGSSSGSSQTMTNPPRGDFMSLTHQPVNPNLASQMGDPTMGDPRSGQIVSGQEVGRLKVPMLTNPGQYQFMEPVFNRDSGQWETLYMRDGQRHVWNGREMQAVQRINTDGQEVSTRPEARPFVPMTEHQRAQYSALQTVKSEDSLTDLLKALNNRAGYKPAHIDTSAMQLTVIGKPALGDQPSVRNIKRALDIMGGESASFTNVNGEAPVTASTREITQTESTAVAVTNEHGGKVSVEISAEADFKPLPIKGGLKMGAEYSGKQSTATTTTNTKSTVFKAITAPVPKGQRVEINAFQNVSQIEGQMYVQGELDGNYVVQGSQGPGQVTLKSQLLSLMAENPKAARLLEAKGLKYNPITDKVTFSGYMPYKIENNGHVEAIITYYDAVTGQKVGEKPVILESN
ncbi:hypothetical protein, partial [Bacillus cereus]